MCKCRYEAYVLYIFMQLLIHFLGGENSLIVHLEFKVCILFVSHSIEEDQVAMALRWSQAFANGQVISKNSNMCIEYSLEG